MEIKPIYPTFTEWSAEKDQVDSVQACAQCNTPIVKTRWQKRLEEKEGLVAITPYCFSCGDKVFKTIGE